LVTDDRFREDIEPESEKLFRKIEYG